MYNSPGTKTINMGRIMRRPSPNEYSLDLSVIKKLPYVEPDRGPRRLLSQISQLRRIQPGYA